MNTAKKHLNILPDEEVRDLRGTESQYLREVVWPPSSDSEQPRALRSLAKIVDGGLCHRCGSCIGICPTGVLGLSSEEYPEVQNLSACTDCDLCVKVCPGDEFNYRKAYEEFTGTSPNLKNTHGYFEKAVIAHTNDSALRENSTSGGLITAILLDLLESKKIDGAVVIASDEEHLWKGKPIVARTKEDILKATKSKYAISPTNSVFSEILNQPGRYALVGLPCQLHGFHKAAKLDKRLDERVVLTLGLFCHAAIEHEAFRIIWESLGEKASRAKRFVSRIGKHPGAPHIELDDGTLHPVYFGDKRGYKPSSMEVINILYRLYTPERCLTCFDALAEFADISVGDPWMAPPDDDVDFYKGWSFALLRSERGVEAFNDIASAGGITYKDLTNKEAHSCNTHMATEKRWRSFRVIETHRRQGKPIPSYGDPTEHLPRHNGLQFLGTEINMLTHIFCFLPRQRARLLKFFLGSGGYYLFWLNNKRRTLKFWFRDTFALIKRKLLGRR